MQEEKIIDITAKIDEEKVDLSGINSLGKNMKQAIKMGLTKQVLAVLFIICCALVVLYFLGYQNGYEDGIAAVKCPEIFNVFKPI
jgi:hypothetical protein